MATRRAGRAAPVHDLGAIQQAAAAGRVTWQDSVTDDLVKYEYTVDEVLKCLQALEARHFSTTKDYQDGKGPFDVYHIPWHHHIQSQNRVVVEKLYIKLKLTQRGRAAFMLSFHPADF